MIAGLKNQVVANAEFFKINFKKKLKIKIYFKKCFVSSKFFIN